MRGTDRSHPQPDAALPPPSSRQPLLWGAGLLTALLLGAFFAFHALRPKSSRPLPTTFTPTVEIRTSSTPKLTFSSPPVGRPTPTAPAPAPLTAPGPRSPHDLMAELTALSGLSGPLTKEQAERFKQDLAELVRQGAASVPAIEEFLKKNADFDYSQLEGGDQLGYPSLRASLFDTLKQIGGPEAQATMLEALKSTALPTEMLALAQNLDSETPGVYREQILNAAQEALAMDASGQLGTNREVGPAFRMLQNYGTSSTIDEMAKTDPVNFYNALNLAGLPDGQGLASLLQMAQSSSPGSQSIATEMIAQLAGDNPQALDSLLQMAQKGQISNGAWMRMAPILAGDQYQIDSSGAQAANAGDLNFTVVNSATTPDQINQRIALLNQIMGYVTPGSAAEKSLEHERDQLLARLGN